ncbi:hypothetical protein A2619_01585 [candidate division WWE3 bacterium RIFOXYD1_FULL_39_9]|uniref:Uncharacterized protein n=1 Tax=candidate division WWE3 bacterium RIFOXYD1_FULL_39_9 TaxID=1802649 RepID=A0A1F4X619_UNCKA|nr:MAG: hypothetical protein A2619_01585 [candidate division WWE3 bacterium RIFOXYD1_FULL_39_9]
MKGKFLYVVVVAMLSGGLVGAVLTALWGMNVAEFGGIPAALVGAVIGTVWPKNRYDRSGALYYAGIASALIGWWLFITFYNPAI